MELLFVLLDHRDRVVSKNELLDLVWPGVVVEENNIQVQTSAIRKLLGPDAISTIPGRGYKFTLASTGDDASEPASGSSAAKDRQTTAHITNLPASVPVIYGRRSDEAHVAALLQQHRILSIVGAGGIGKTCLALAVATRWRHDYPDGVWWIDLSKLAQVELVVGEVARVLGIALTPSRPAVEVVADALRPLSLLLVLDNCEHLLSAVATLAEAVSSTAPGVALLSTSQEPLRTSTEHIYRLDVLGLPTGPTLAAVSASGAVQLFVARAKAAERHFELTESNAESVAEICTRLDGMPFALELAAARIPLLGLEGLRSRLDERFEVLTGGSRFVLRRHQTLRAALDFSYGLLTEQEQAVFRALSVFAGSFSVENAQEVAFEDGFESWTSLDCLGTLVDKSMVIAEG
ncbi:MAG: winged helix-turn-helix domain-containing protein, partial [Caldimonas sp.]